MRKYFLRLLKFSVFDGLLLMIYLALFIYFILQPAIYSPDTGTYWHLNVYRFPVYSLFLRTMEFVFGDYYNLSVVGFQLLFGFAATYVFLKKMVNLLKLNSIIAFALFAVLIFPFFPPLEIGNNLTSEGIAYPLYLMLIVYGIDVLFLDKKIKIISFGLVFIALCLTRGQFIVFAPILLFLYILRHKKMVFGKNHLMVALVLLLLPLAVNLMDRTYRKLVHDHFESTPYTFINAITLPLYLSDQEDVNLFTEKDEKIIFSRTYSRLDSLGLLSSKVDGTLKDKYSLFHNKFPYICNQTFQTKGEEYYYSLNPDPVEKTIATENTAKKMFSVLLKKHLKDWFSMYFTSIIHGFQAVVIFIFVLLVFIYSGWKSLKGFNLYHGMLFFASILILSNAFITAFAVHTIIRYTFYNLGMGFIIVFLLSRKLISKL